MDYILIKCVQLKHIKITLSQILKVELLRNNKKKNTHKLLHLQLHCVYIFSIAKTCTQR